MKKINKAFSLAELMIVMLILTIILAATMPILSKRAKMKAAAAATVSLPVVAEGVGTCTPNTVGISSDGTTLLTCQGGTWKKPSSGGAGTTLYLYGQSSVNNPPTCASIGSNWIQAAYGTFENGTWGRSIRTCYNASQTCATAYLYGQSSVNNPPTCASVGTGWVQASYGTFENGTWGRSIRTCYKCS